MDFPILGKQEHPTLNIERPTSKSDVGCWMFDVLRRYPLMPVIEMPSMNVFCVKKNRKMIGKTTRVLAAIR